MDLAEENFSCLWSDVAPHFEKIQTELRGRVVLDLVALDAEFSATRRTTLPDFSQDMGDHEARRRALLAEVGEGARATVL